MKARVINGALQTLPASGQLQSGEWVSNYNLLPDKTLKAEGWKDVEEIKPDVAEGQTLVIDGFQEKGKKIVVTYAARDDEQKAQKGKRKAAWAKAATTEEKLRIIAEELGLE